MTAATLRILMVALFLSGAVAMDEACYVEEDVPLRYAGYDPAFYDGYVVYYDQVGRPFYYLNGIPVWVPPTSPAYLRLVNHWRVHAGAYPGWYAHYGYRYRGYRGGDWRR
jgi:hypothetical protein